MSHTGAFPSLDELLHSLNLTGERAQIECKESTWQLPRDVWETVSAFSNTAGGTLLLGVAERQGQFEVTGLIDASKIQHDLASGLRDKMNVPIPAQVEPIIVPVADQEHVVLSVYIPEALPYQKPIYIRSKGLDKGCYKRVAGQDMPCSEDDLARFFQARSFISPDMTPVPMARREELDSDQIRAFRRLLTSQDPTNPVLTYDDDDLLRAYGALIQPEGQQTLVPTVAGVLMFGTPALIRRCFPAFRVDLIEAEGTEWVAAPTDQQKALVYARKTGRVDNAAFRRLNHTDTLTASRALTHLESLGLLRRSEQRRGPGVYYTLVEGEETPQITPKVTPDTVSQLLSLLREGKRLSRDQTITLIVSLCSERPHTARELAQVLNRNADYLRNAYLSPLVREGRLQLTGAPNAPNVAYRA